MEEFFTRRRSLDEICRIPERIISVYSLEQHVWDDGNAPEARQLRMPEMQTIEEFQIDPVRPFLNDILRNMAAPYKPEQRDQPIGQGYWIQAEFGSGKSHLLCFLGSLALGDQDAWEKVKAKEEKAGRGRRESLYRFWEEGLETKSSSPKKGIFVVVKTLVGAGGGTVGYSERGRPLVEYIIDAAKEQLQLELGKNLSLYPAELLADRFIEEDVERYRADLKKFLKDPRYFDEDEFEEAEDFIREIQQNKSPEYKRSCGNKLWRFYDEYLKVRPQIVAETEDILQHMVQTILAEGYSGVLLVLDEVSLFMKNRDDDQRAEDEKTLVVLSNRLAKVHNLPIWTVCAAQQAIESKVGVKNIIADDRLKLVKLLEADKDYYDIVLARVRDIIDPEAIGSYYLYYKRGFTWPNSIGEQDFRHFFPFHKPALEVLRAITYELTTARSAIHFMHQTLKHQMRAKGMELIRLWELFDEAVRYEEDPSGVHAGLVAIKTKRETEYLAYEACKRQIEGQTKGALKVYRDKSIKTVQTLFLYHISRTRQQGLTPEEIANSVLMERAPDANPDENILHYEQLAEQLRRELRQIVQSVDDENRPRYRFDPVFTGIDPRVEFQKARDEAEANEQMQREAWEALLALEEWPIRARQMTIDLASGHKSLFRSIASSKNIEDQSLEVVWQGRQVTGRIGMRDLGRIAAEHLPLPILTTDEKDEDFAVYVGTRAISQQMIQSLLAQRGDPRIILWTPGELSADARQRLFDFAAYRKLVGDWQGKDTDDAVTVLNWVSNALQADMGKIIKVIDETYARGRVDALKHSQMDFRVAGELSSIMAPLVERVLTAAYESRDIAFDPPFIFRKEEGVKVINGIVKTGTIPKGAKPNQDISAAQNFGFGLKLMKRGAERDLDVSENPYVQAIGAFIDEKLSDSAQTMRVETLYKNFMGIGGPKDYGLTRRMVQIYLLCLVKVGRIRIGLSPKVGLSIQVIDYSTIAGIEFSARVLDGLTEVQKMARPENWEVLRPYLEKLLDTSIPSTHDDAVIAQHRSAMRALFLEEGEEAGRLAQKAKTLFEVLKIENPYKDELQQMLHLFAAQIDSANDIDGVLYALKGALGYQAYDTGAVTPLEVADLANRLQNYRALQRFLSFDRELQTVYEYAHHPLPDLPQLKQVCETQRVLAAKLEQIKPYIDSEVKLRTELLGRLSVTGGAEEAGTLSALIREYTSVYTVLHDGVMDVADTARRRIQDLLRGKELQAMQRLEQVSALRSSVPEDVTGALQDLANNVFFCAQPSKSSIETQLQRGPVHECSLSFQNAANHTRQAQETAKQAILTLEEAINRKVKVFLTPNIQDRLRQGGAEPGIAALLRCETLDDLRGYLVEASLADPALIDQINRYLKQVIVKKIRMADFKPAMSTVGKDQIGDLVLQFRRFLEQELNSIEEDGDTLPMLQVE
jgi:hypothetical protein